MTGLTFAALRAANIERLPQFKNKHGEPAHTKPDGSDWAPCQWLKALLGELGELCTVRRAFEEGELDYGQLVEMAAKEMADVQTYLDIAALRMLDTTSDYPIDWSESQTLCDIVAELGEYANTSKKFDRRELSTEACGEARRAMIAAVRRHLDSLASCPILPNHTADRVLRTTANGIDLGAATVEKFNEVSWRVGARVFLKGDV